MYKHFLDKRIACIFHAIHVANFPLLKERGENAYKPP